MIITQTPRLILRHFLPSDCEAMLPIFADPEVMRYSDGIRSPQWVQSWLADCINTYYPQWGFGPYAIVEKSSPLVIGYCGLTRLPHRCAPNETELGFRLARAYWGQGLATEAAIAMRDYAFTQLHLRRLIALIDPANLPSIKVAKKVGLHYLQDAILPGYDHPDHLYIFDP